MMIYVLTIITLGYSAYTDRRTLIVHPVISIGMLAVWLCYRIAQLIKSMDTLEGDLEKMGITLMISMTSFIISVLFTSCFGLGLADAVWIMTTVLAVGPEGILVISISLAGFLLYLYLMKTDGQKEPLIPFVFSSFFSYIAAESINRLITK